jgi:hypothetical protein
MDEEQEMNRRRARWAQNAIEAFAEETGLDPDVDGWDSIMGDLLTDMMHFADQRGVSWPELEALAYRRFEEEIEEAGGPSRKRWYPF